MLRQDRTQPISWQILAFVALSTTLLFGCKELHTPIDAPEYTSPSVSILSPTDTSIDLFTLPPETKLPSDNLTVTLVIHARAVDSVGISSVAGSISSPNFREKGEKSSVIENSRFALTDDGQGDDNIAGDGIYSGSVTFERFRYEVGTYNITVQATNTVGISSSQARVAFRLTNSGNRPPTIEYVKTVADTMIVPDEGFVADTLYAKVSDKDNPRDLLSVKVRARKPSGAFAASEVFLKDDGRAENADAVAGDGIFSTGIKLEKTENLERGQYTFIFTATDKSGAQSQDSLVIVVQ